MAVPTPPAALNNSCSVIHDNTLYSYTRDAFLSIPLADGAKWNQLPMGVKVTGATCVGSTPPNAGQASFFVVGGKADAGDYTGLQKYTYSTGQWTTIKPSDEVTKDRLGHASIYIPADDVILVYSGSQDGNTGPSGQTFTIRTSEPYTVRGHDPVAPPAMSPKLFMWSDADAAMLSGANTDPQGARIWLFNPTAGWRDSGASLANPLQVTTRAVMVNEDGSKVLYTFDLGQLPPKVDRMVVQDAKGAPVRNSPPVAESNSTFAPTVAMQNFATAQGPDGMVVMSGGSEDKPVVAVFNTNKNGWVDAAALFGGKGQRALLAPTTSTSASSTMQTSTATTTAASRTTATTTKATTTAGSAPAAGLPSTAADQDDGQAGPSSSIILGITLGSIMGFIALLGIILLLMKRRKKNQKHAEAALARGASGSPSDEKYTAGMAKSTLAMPSAGQVRGHYPQASQESYSSMAILMGRVDKNKSGLTRKASNDTTGSSDSSLHKLLKSTISKPIPQTTDHPAVVGQDDRAVAFPPPAAPPPRPRNRSGPSGTQDGIRRSSGWNRYWSGGSALQILGFGAPRRSTTGSERSSRYSEATTNHNHDNTRVTQDSATMPNLNFEGRPEVNNVNSGSPVVSQFAVNVAAQGMSGKDRAPHVGGVVGLLERHTGKHQRRVGRDRGGQAMGCRQGAAVGLRPELPIRGAAASLGREPATSARHGGQVIRHELAQPRRPVPGVKMWRDVDLI